MSTRSRAHPWWGSRRDREDFDAGPRRAEQSAEVERLLGADLYGTQRLTNADPVVVSLHCYRVRRMFSGTLA